MIISVDAGKFPPIQQLSMIKVQNMDIEGAYLNMIKNIYEKPMANIILSGAKLKAYPQIRNKTRRFTVATFIQPSFGSPSHSNQEKRETLKWRRSKTVNFHR